MKAIILAGGSGTRLAPMTASITKHLLPLYDKPMLYYPLSTLMMAGITEYLIISTARDLPMIEALLGNGKRLGISIEYAVQDAPKGIAEAFIIGEKFIDGQPVCLMLGDNVFFGHKMIEPLAQACVKPQGASVFAYFVRDPERYGVVTFDASNRAVSLVEKPKTPTSNWAVTGVYVYDASVVEVAKSLAPSARGELEITDVNKVYLQQGNLQVIKLGRGVAWLDTGTPESMLEASQFIHVLEARQGLKFGCIEEVALRKNYVALADLDALVAPYSNNAYGAYVRRVAQDMAEGQ
jgi:glucose-1-phosphate thymidylyltransferase